MCKINSLRLTSESNREQSQIIYSVCLCCFVFKEFPMKGNYWQTGGVEVAFSFGLFGRFPDYLPLGQQYLPLNRKPRIWLPVVDYPRARGRVADAGLNARGLWERDCTFPYSIPSPFMTLLRTRGCHVVPNFWQWIVVNLSCLYNKLP